jgi:hypothetical protein
MEFPFITTSQKELHCSKWLKHALLLTEKEMVDLFSIWAPYYLFSPIQKGEKHRWLIGEEEFLNRYREYLLFLKENDVFPPPGLRKNFTLLLAASLEDIYAVPTKEEMFFLKAKRPVIQLQLYHAFFSRADGKIHAMAMDSSSFSFGLQIAYPQIYEDSLTGEYTKILHGGNFPTTLLYQQTIQWIRKNTRPFSYQQKGEEKIAPFRVGKEKLDWSSDHKQFYRLIGG